MKLNWNKLLTNGKAMYLAYDQGLEHGPVDFNDVNVDPAYIMKLAKMGGYNGIIFQKGIAEKYYDKSVPLIVKLNGKTNLVKGEPYSTQLCSVQEAIELGASAVGYTIYVGSEHEAEMFKDFEKIQEQAHDKNIPVIAWMYPRGKAVEGKDMKKIIPYAARVGLELGADMIKINYTGDVESFKWAVEAAGKVKTVVAGGVKEAPKEFLTDVAECMKAGSIGIAVGRNVWQYKDPIKMTKAIRKIVFENKTAEEAMKEL